MLHNISSKVDLAYIFNKKIHTAITAWSMCKPPLLLLTVEHTVDH